MPVKTTERKDIRGASVVYCCTENGQERTVLVHEDLIYK